MKSQKLPEFHPSLPLDLPRQGLARDGDAAVFDEEADGDQLISLPFHGCHLCAESQGVIILEWVFVRGWTRRG